MSQDPQITTDHDVVDVLMTDHREVELVFTELEGLFGPDADADRRREVTDNVTTELVQHAGRGGRGLPARQGEGERGGGRAGRA